MSDQDTNQAHRSGATPRGGRLALILALLALAGTAAQWLGIPGRGSAERRLTDELAKTQRRLKALDDRLQRERDELAALAQKIGGEGADDDSLASRVVRLESAMAKMPGGERVRFVWLLEQAEYFMRMANTQESLAGDSGGAMTALQIADEHLRDAADPRLTPVRKLVASEIAALRAVPRVDTEGMILKLATLADALGTLPRRQSAPSSFRPAAAAPPAATNGVDRATQALRSAFLSIVNVRRTDEPVVTLLSDESAVAVIRSMEIELQLARLALMRRQPAIFRSSLAAVRRDLRKYFDVGSAGGANALAVVDELMRVPLPETLPDVSASLTELLRVKERTSQP
jgi:uroporphyrin-3 C-methyltransferase